MAYQPEFLHLNGQEDMFGDQTFFNYQTYDQSFQAAETNQLSELAISSFGDQITAPQFVYTNWGWWPEQPYSMYQPAPQQNNYIALPDQCGDRSAQPGGQDSTNTASQAEYKLNDFEKGMELRMFNVEEAIKNIQSGLVIE
jgi:hypothetical protein